MTSGLLCGAPGRQADGGGLRADSPADSGVDHSDWPVAAPVPVEEAPEEGAVPGAADGGPGERGLEGTELDDQPVDPRVARPARGAKAPRPRARAGSS